ncbi:uncharacterized protein LOC144484286 [Mustelus asterias]
MEVPAGKLKVMERFFSPIPQRSSGRGGGASVEADPRGRGSGPTRRNCLPSHSSFSSTSLSSEASLEGSAFPPRPLPVRREQSWSCLDVRPARESGADPGARASGNPGSAREGREERGRVSPRQASIPDPRQAGRRQDRTRPTELRKAKSMESIALGRPRGPSPLPGPGAPGKGKKGRSGQGSELASAGERLVRQKVKFSQFLDEITAQVLSPASLRFLRPQDGPVGGDGEPSQCRGVKAGATRDGKAWQEEAPARHRREGRSASPDRGPSPSPRRGPKRQLTEEGPRQPVGARGSEPGPARARPIPLDAGHLATMGAAWHLERDSPGGRHSQEGGGGGSGKLTDSASSLEMGPVHHTQPGIPAGDTYANSSSSPEESWVVEIQPQAAGLAQEMLTDAHHLRYVQEESSGLQRNLGCAAHRTEIMDADFKSSHGHLETELQRAQAGLEELRAKFQRLQENYSNTQQVNELMEEKLHTISQGMETERKDLNLQISELTNRLTNAQRTICSLQNIHPPHRVAALLPTAATQHGHDLLDAGVDRSPFLDVPVYTPPAPFMDEVPETGAEGPDCPAAKVTATPPAVDKPQRRGNDGLHRPEGQASRSGREEPTRPPRARLASGPRRQTAFTPWSQCLEDDPLLGWPNLGKGGKARAAGGKPEMGRPPSAGLLAVSPDDPFGPIDPGERLTAALHTTSEGGPRELSLKGTFRKDRNRESRRLPGEVSSSAGSEDEATEGWSRMLAGKAHAGAPKGFNYQLGRSGLGKLSQCPPPPGLEGKGNLSPSPGLLGANRGPKTPPGLAGSWAHQWGEEVGRQLSGWGRDEEEEEGTARRPRAAAGRTSGGGEGVARGGLEPTARARPSPGHPPAAAPRKHRNQAATRD